MKNKIKLVVFLQKLICSYLILISLGILIDSYHKLDNYGASYNVTIIIDGVIVNDYIADSVSYLIFSIIFVLITIASSIVLLELMEIQKR